MRKQMCLIASPVVAVAFSAVVVRRPVTVRRTAVAVVVTVVAEVVTSMNTKTTVLIEPQATFENSMDQHPPSDTQSPYHSGFACLITDQGLAPFWRTHIEKTPTAISIGNAVLGSQSFFEVPEETTLSQVLYLMTTEFHCEPHEYAMLSAEMPETKLVPSQNSTASLWSEGLDRKQRGDLLDYLVSINSQRGAPTKPGEPAPKYLDQLASALRESGYPSYAATLCYSNMRSTFGLAARNRSMQLGLFIYQGNTILSWSTDGKTAERAKSSGDSVFYYPLADLVNQIVVINPFFLASKVKKHVTSYGDSAGPGNRRMLQCAYIENYLRRHMVDL